MHKSSLEYVYKEIKALIIKELNSWLDLCVTNWKSPEQKRCHRPNRLWKSLHLRDIHGVDVLTGRCWAGQSAAGLYPDGLVELPIVGTWSQASTGTIALTQAGAYKVSILAQLSAESLRGAIFSAEVLYNEVRGTIVFPGIPVPESDKLGLFAVALVVLGLTFWRKPSRVFGASLRVCQPGAQPL